MVVVKAATKNQQDRRSYFRIEDEITLIYKEVIEGDIQDIQEVGNEILDLFSLSSALESLTQDSRMLLKGIQRSQPEIASFLKILDKKIGLISQTLLLKETNLSNYATTKVNISAAGLAFDAEKAMEPGAVLELKLILPPSLAAFVTYGKVVYCNTCLGKSQNSHHIGVDFIMLREQDRELLVRHIVKKQLQQLKTRNMSA